MQGAVAHLTLVAPIKHCLVHITDRIAHMHDKFGRS